MNSSQETLSYNSQLKATVLLSFGFMMILTSYISVEGIVTKFYESNGHQYYGRISLITIYAVFALSTTYSSSIIKAFGYKLVFICGALCYVALNSSALIIYVCNNQLVAIGTILITSALCGLAAGNIWVGHNAYLGQIASKQNLSLMFGISEGIQSFSLIFGYIMTFYVFKYYDGETFFKVLIPIGLLSAVLFCFLPTPSNKQNYKKIDETNIVGLEKIRVYFKLLTIKQNYETYIYFSLNAFHLTLLSVFTFKLVDGSTFQQPNQSLFEYNERSTYLLGIALLCCGIGRCIVTRDTYYRYASSDCFLTKKITDHLDSFQFCYYSALLTVISIIVAAASYYLSNYWICCLFSFLLGAVFATSRNSCNLLLKEAFDNDLDIIGISFFVLSAAFIFNVVLLFILVKISMSFCLLVYFIIFIYIANCTKKIGKIMIKAQNDKNGIQMIKISQ